MPRPILTILNDSTMPCGDVAFPVATSNEAFKFIASNYPDKAARHPTRLQAVLVVDCRC